MDRTGAVILIYEGNQYQPRYAPTGADQTCSKKMYTKMLPTKKELRSTKGLEKPAVTGGLKSDRSCGTHSFRISFNIIGSLVMAGTIWTAPVLGWFISPGEPLVKYLPQPVSPWLQELAELRGHHQGSAVVAPPRHA